jgi:Ca2+-binding RTX toxin-like protein
LIGGFGLDLLNAGNGNDSLDGGYENDVMLGLAGNDTMHAGLGGGGKSTDDDLIDGGKDYDLVSYNGRKGTVTVDADNVADDGHVEEKDNVRGSVENIAGGNGNDLLTGNAAPNLLLGQAGNDTLRVRGDGTLKNTTDGGLGRDVCQVDAGDTRKNCEA